MSYQHQTLQGTPIPLPAGKAVCVGRNYADHIAELNNATPSEPILFIKPVTALCDAKQPVEIPTDQGACHNEIEIALLIDKPLCRADAEQASQAIWGIGLALDLTLRDLQSQLKQKGLPWERAKGFDGACPVSAFLPMAHFPNLQDLGFALEVNDEVRQQGHTSHMLWPIIQLLCEISHTFTLLPGDIVLTGTPKGVGPLNPGDRIRMSLADSMVVLTDVVARGSSNE